MSEYQFVYFRAVDEPLNDKAMVYMRRQSTRASITRRDFRNEYHFGDFRGNAPEMLRRGFDVHLHYANFGIRKLMFRLPHGFPGGIKSIRPYTKDGPIRWLGDKSGAGGILEFESAIECHDYLDESDIEQTIAELDMMRQGLMAGDLRYLYVAWLCGEPGEDCIEPPVPAGLDPLPTPLMTFSDFLCAPGELLEAAAQISPKMENREPAVESNVARWIAAQPAERVASLAIELLGSDHQKVRQRTIGEVHMSLKTAEHPTVEPRRTYGQLGETAEKIYHARIASETRKKAAARKRQLEKLASDPAAVFENARDLFADKKTHSYELAVKALSDLCEALGPDFLEETVIPFVEEIVKQYPHKRTLKKVLLAGGLLPCRGGRT